MKLLNITSCFNDILIIDNNGIKAYSKKYNRRDQLSKMSFNVEIIDNHIIISHGDDYQYYDFHDQYVINQLSLHGLGTFHIKMNLNESCLITQHDCTCHLYHLKNNLQLYVNINNGKLIGCHTIKKLNSKLSNSIIKDFDVSHDIYMAAKNNSFICLTTMAFAYKKYYIDAHSTIIINGQKMYNSNMDIWSNL